MPWPLLALGVSVWQIFRSGFRRRALWILLVVLQPAALLLTLFYQSRFAVYAQMFGVVPLAFLMQWGLRRRKLWDARLRGHDALWWLLLPALAVGIPAMMYHSSAVDIALFPMQGYTPPCNVRPAIEKLSQPPYYTGTPRLVLNSIDEGPELLLRTPHHIVSAPFHENVKGNLDAASFFRAQNMNDAASIARRLGADFLLSCRDIETAYLIAEEEGAPDGYIRMPLPPPLAFRLTKPELVPDWLQPIDLGPDAEALLFKVLPEKR
jgi:hypothetical protein